MHSQIAAAAIITYNKSRPPLTVLVSDRLLSRRFILPPAGMLGTSSHRMLNVSRQVSQAHLLSACRPLTAAVAAAGRGTFTLDGTPRMRERPIQDLVDGLTQLGVDAACTLGTGCPPVLIRAQGLPTGTVSAHCACSCFHLLHALQLEVIEARLHDCVIRCQHAFV